MALVDCVGIAADRRLDNATRASSSCVQSFVGGHCFPQYAEEGHILGPYVIIDFVDQQHQGGGAAVTVSNRSSEATNPKHCAVIKSFELGYSDGTTCRVTIHDTQGGAFEEFMKHLVKDWMCLKKVQPASLLMKVWFGWVKNGCNVPLPSSVSPCYYVMCDSIEANFSQGKMIFEITGKDVCHRMFEGGVEWQGGGEGQQAMHLLDAIDVLMKDTAAPNVGKVSFKRMQRGNVMSAPTHPMFRGNTDEERRKGPKRKWDAKAQTKLEIVKRWLDECPSINGKGWQPQYDTTKPGGELVYWERTSPNCQNESDAFWDANCLGTYIVNGGKDSAVIEFNPKIRWDFSALTSVGGQIGSRKMNSMNTEGAKNPGHECMPRETVEGAGQIQMTGPSDAQIDAEGENAERDAAEKDAEAKKTIRLQFHGVEADLVIVGNPTICPPSDAIMVKNITIVLINPFHLVPNGNQCGEWLSIPPCNHILSSKAWICRSITHRIEAGIFTTTIGVILPIPGVDAPSDLNLGLWTRGWKPPSC